MLQLYLFGVPSISINDHSLPQLTGPSMPMRLFAFIALHPAQPHERDRLAHLFWPMLPATRGRATLSNILWRLQKMVKSDELFITNKRTVQLNPDFPISQDVVRFDSESHALLVQATTTDPVHLDPLLLQQMEATLRWYRGPLLEGMDDEWLMPLRAKWHERFCNTLIFYIDYCKTVGALAQAAAAAQRLVDVEPDRQDAHQRLIQIALRAGHQQAAQHYFACYEAHWRDVLQLPLSAEMLALAEQHQLRSPITAPSRHTKVQQMEPQVSIEQASLPEYLRRELAICIQNDELYDLKADRKKQEENLTRAWALAEKLGDLPAQVDLFARQAWLFTRQGAYVNALTCLQDGLRLSQQAQLPTLQALLHRLFGVASEELGNFDTALHHYKQALTLDEAYQVVALMSANLNNIASVQITLAHYTDALATLGQANRLLKPTSATAYRVKIQGNRGIAWMRLGQLGQATEDLQAAISLAQRSGEHDAEWWLATRIAMLYHLQGETRHGIHLVLHHSTAVEASGDNWIMMASCDLLAACYLAINDSAQSQLWAERLWTKAQQKNLWRYQLRGLLRLAQLALHRQDEKTSWQLAKALVRQYETRERTSRCILPQAQADTTKLVSTSGTANEMIEEAVELFYTAMCCAELASEEQFARAARTRAQLFLQAQLNRIVDPTLRATFLQVRPFTQALV